METKEVIEFEVVNHHAAGIDTGSREIYVLPNGMEVVSFKTFTGDYHKCCDYLKSKGIKSVAMEATGVYWISLYDIFGEIGLESLSGSSPRSAAGQRQED
jgi:hypothetical protein